MHRSLYVNGRHLVHLRPPLPTVTLGHKGSLCASLGPEQA